MTLLSEIKQAQLAARKAKDEIAANLLTTLIGEAEMVGKNNGNRESTDAEVIAVVKKFIKNTEETVKVLDPSDCRIANLQTELKILAQYLPAQFNEELLTRVLSSIKVEISAGPKDMGKMLGLLKSRFAGQYDGAMASAVAKRILAG